MPGDGRKVAQILLLERKKRQVMVQSPAGSKNGRSGWPYNSGLRRGIPREAPTLIVSDEMTDCCARDAGAMAPVCVSCGISPETSNTNKDRGEEMKEHSHSSQ